MTLGKLNTWGKWRKIFTCICMYVYWLFLNVPCVNFFSDYYFQFCFSQWEAACSDDFCFKQEGEAKSEETFGWFKQVLAWNCKKFINIVNKIILNLYYLCVRIITCYCSALFKTQMFLLLVQIVYISMHFMEYLQNIICNKTVIEC